MSGHHSDKPQLILASASPRRRELLRQVGVRFRVVVAEVDERVLPGEAPAAYVLRVAKDKALAIRASEGARLPVLGADTAVVLDQRILGKPVDRPGAIAMLRSLSGRTHEVYSAAVLVQADRSARECLNISRVTFAELDMDWIEAYCDSGDPMDKAGSYGVQGQAAEKIARIEGSFSGVMGLPLYETCQLLRQAEVLF
jgi:septum formation protein